jgi:hypothetical protein
MTAPTMDLTRPDTLVTGALGEWDRVAADLAGAHLEAAHAAAELDLDQAAIWVAADAAIREIATEAYRCTALITGREALTAAARVRPVVRLRELAAAQAGLMRALDRAVQTHQGDVVVAAEALRSAPRIRHLARRLAAV